MEETDDILETPLKCVMTVGLEVLDFLKGILIGILMALVYGFRAILPASLIGKKSVTNELVLITGAGSGIGRLLTIRFAQLGARLVLLDINEKGNEETAATVRKLGADVTTYTCDLSSRADIYRVADLIKKNVGDVDILINNAGIVTGKKLFESPDDLMVKTMEVNAMAHFWTTKAFLPKMLDRNHGHIVSIASAAGLVGNAGLVDYCASKYAAVGFAESLEMELRGMGKDNIFTTTVCPFFINTGMFDGVVTKFPTILPLLCPEYVADKITEAILINSQVLYLPRLLYPMLILKTMFPAKVGIFLMDYFGVTHSMDHFKGRNGNNTSPTKH